MAWGPQRTPRVRSALQVLPALLAMVLSSPVTGVRKTPMDKIPRRPRRLAMSARRSVIPLYTPILAPAFALLPTTPFLGICLLTLPVPHGNLPCQLYRSSYHVRASPPVPLIPQATAIPPTLFITAFTHPRHVPPLIRQTSTALSPRLPP